MQAEQVIRFLTSLYIAAVSRDTKTYTATGVRVRVGLVQAG